MGDSEKLNILVVDDSPDSRFVLSCLLKGRGYTVDIASDGAAALVTLVSRHYDLIFLDCQMPTMDGFDAARGIRKLEKDIGSYTPIVAMTANEGPEIRQHCLESGMDGFLSKPFNFQELMGALERWISKGSVPQPSFGTQLRRSARV